MNNVRLSDQDCILQYDEFIPSEEGRREALCALGNGYFVSRAAAFQSKADGIHCPGTYIAGVYNRLKTEVQGRNVEREDLVNMPDWLFLNFAIDGGEWFNLSQVEILSYRQQLNLTQGILYKDISFKDKKDRKITLSERRFVHMRLPHLAGLEIKIQAHNWSGDVTIVSALDGKVVNSTSVYDGASRKHLSSLESSINDNMLYLKMQTSQSCISVAEAARTFAYLNDSPVVIARKNTIEPDYVAQEMQISMAKGDCLTIRKVASIFTSRDPGISEPGLAARESCIDAPEFETLIAEQISAWQNYWSHFDLSMQTKEGISKVDPALLLHLNIFHVLSTVSVNSIGLDIGLPARGWSEGYQGHIFWDDIYIFPLLIMRVPSIAREMLAYRYQRLGEAKRIAKSAGLPGVRYPWQSGSSGREETPEGWWDKDRNVWVPDDSHLQVHVNASVAYNMWQYYQATGDLEFMFMCGANVLLEIARYFAHIAHYNPERDRYEIHGVVGPDEMHVGYRGNSKPGINNNAYTNLMAVWTICRALELLNSVSELAAKEIYARLNLTSDELKLWEDVSQKMYVPLLENGIISQFEGYEKLKIFPWQKDGFIDMERLNQILKESGGYVNEYQVSKQADVLLLFYLFSREELEELFGRLGYTFEPEMIVKNIAYYVPQTVNYSTLSRVAVSWVLSRVNRPESWKILSEISKNKNAVPMEKYPRSWDILQEAVTSDISSISTPQGIHLGAMAGTVDIVQRCYTGIVTKNNILWINPCLPDHLTSLSFHLQYRQQTVHLEISQKEVKVTASQSHAAPIKIGFEEKIYELGPKESKVFRIKSRRHS